MSDVRSRLDAALAAREIVAIRYHGGRAPGSYREILPLRVTHTGKLQAKCMTHGGIKLLVFDKIELVPLATPRGSLSASES